jgi:hypothetical protein
MTIERTPEEQAALKAKLSKTAKSNVRRSKCHERRVAALLTAWAGVEFRRRRVEGRDVRTIERESTADVIPVKGDIHFSIEAKCGEVTSLDALMASPARAVFTTWWHQACYDATLITNHFGRQFYPIMFFKPHPNFDWLAVSVHAFLNGVLKSKHSDGSFPPSLGLDEAVWFPHLYFSAYRYLGPISRNVVRTKKKENFRFIPLSLDPVVLCRWRDFAEHVDPASFFLAPPQNYSGPVSGEVSDGVLRQQDGIGSS